MSAASTAGVRRFASRLAAGEALSRKVGDALGGEPAIVLALPRGGVPTAVPVARELGAALDVILVRKAAAAGNQELGIGAVAEGGVRFLDGTLVRRLGMDPSEVNHSLAVAEHELAAQVAEYRSGSAPLELSGHTVVIVDDGLATGSTASAAVDSARARGAGRVVVAGPVASREAVLRLSGEADEVICLEVPDPFRAVGEWYEDFAPVPAAEAHSLLAQAQAAYELPRSLRTITTAFP